MNNNLASQLREGPKQSHRLAENTVCAMFLKRRS